MISKSFTPSDIEKKLYQFWESSGFFKAGANAKHGAKPFSILLPPPNVTGSLHMGHAFQHTLMDALTRYHRMRGFDVLWQPGTDHAGIATQLVVERQLEAENLSRHDMGRDKFIDRVWAWKNTSGGTITQQMRRLGASCDWQREKFTMDDDLSKIVTEVFVKLYREGLIYRGKRLVNWDPTLKTAVSDLEVENQPRDGLMWFITYPFSNGPQKNHEGQLFRGMTIATTRPETMLADGALCVHPDDTRYQHLIGTMVDLPLCDRQIPIIADNFVDKDFGSGCVKITGAHDFNDYACAIRHQIELIVIMTDDARMNDNAPKAYRSLDRYAAREAVVRDLATQGFLEKTQPHQHNVPVCTRTGEVVEPMLTDQWFVKMDSLAKKGLEAINKHNQGAQKPIEFVPENWENTYRQWLNGIQDWCISRQLWWGHRIPAWFDDKGQIFVARNKDEAQALAGHTNLHQDEDVLDTWFSSALWPFSTLGWQADEAASDPFYQRYLPTSVLVTGFDIIFFWVARMVMMTTHVVGKIPFETVYIHGLVRDAEGHKMSKSKGNVIDPIDIIDGVTLETLIKKRTTGLLQPQQKKKIEDDTKKHFPNGIDAVGADALRFTFAALASHGRDIKFDHHRCEGYRNFCNKLWNATRFVLMQVESDEQTAIENIKPLDQSILSRVPPSFADAWMISTLQRAEAQCATHFAQYRFDLLARTIFELVWDDFCDWFVEAAKVQMQGAAESPEKTERAIATKIRLLKIVEAILRLAHPLLPFITEELWQSVAPYVGQSTALLSKTISLQPYPECEEAKISIEAEAQFKTLQNIVNECRRLRSEMGLPPQQRVPLAIVGAPPHFALIKTYVVALARLEHFDIVESLPAIPAPTGMAEGHPMMLVIKIDKAAETERLNKDKEKIMKEVERIQGQLNNESFVSRAPADIINKQKARLSDLDDALIQINKSLAALALMS